MHKCTQSQSYVGSKWAINHSTTTPCNWQIGYQTHVLCGRTTFGTKFKLGPTLIRLGLGLGSPSWWNQSWFYNPF